MAGVTTGDSNVAIGGYCMGNATIQSSDNTAVGKAAMYNVTTGAYNIAVGHSAMKNGTLTGDANAAVGEGAMISLSGGSENNAFGRYALDSCTTGSQNAAFGHHALGQLTTGSENTAFGGHAPGYEVTTGSTNIFIGNNAGRNTSPATVSTDSNRLVIGDNSLTDAYIRVAFTVTSDARDKTDVESFTHGLSWINKLRPVTYRWDMRSDYEDGIPDGSKKDSRLNIGLIAQEELEVEKEHGYGDNIDNMLVTSENPGGNYGMKYERLVPILINAIKELSTKNDALEARIKTLEG